MTALSGPTEFVSADTEPRMEINAEMAACKYRFVRSQQGEILYTYDQAYTWVAYNASCSGRVIDYSGVDFIL